MNNGRFKILSDLVPTGIIDLDKKIIPNIIKNTLTKHKQNVKDMEILVNYFFNKTNISKKTKIQQKDINNKISVPFPNIAVTTINAYCFANPLTLSSRSEDKQDMVKKLTDALDDDNFASKTLITTLNSGITGLGYKYIRPANSSEIGDGIFFKTIADIDPLSTFVIYSNSLDKEKIMAVNYFNKTKYSEDGSKTEKTYVQYNVWTKYHYWEFTDIDGKLEPKTFNVGNGVNFAYPLPYKKIPIVEYPRKQDRTSDFEIAIDLIDALNNITSNRVDAVQQSVDYLLLLEEDIDTSTEESLAKIKRCLKEGILSFKSIEGATVQPEVKILDMILNQEEVQTLQDEITSKIEEALNIPNRETRSSGGDTGSAVESRNGFRSLENIAGLVTSSTLSAENEVFDIILSICKNFKECPFKDLTTKDIEIKENRNKVENLSNASTAYSVLKSSGMNDITAMQITKLVPDAISVSKMNNVYKQEQEENGIRNEVLKESSLKNIQNEKNIGTSGL